YEGQTIKLDRRTQPPSQAMTTIQHQKHRQAQGITAQLQQQTPKGQLRESQQQLAFLQRNLQTQMTQLFLNKQKQFTSAVQQLDLLSPLKIMGRGYSYTTKEDRVVKTVTELQPADQLTIHYADGTVQANVETITAKKEEF
uniref:exodeoxyribonuclease VII large subunit n=1 Tax=Enterococcus faecium TaxID=1352 RepID=UPI0030C82935